MPCCHQPDAAGPVQVWYLDRTAPLPGAFSMLNTSAWPNSADVSLCSLHEVLETGAVPPRYYLSATACRGILRRAKKRRKTLPEPLMRALRAVAERDTIPESSPPEA